MKSTTNFRALTQSAVAMIVATFAFVACSDYDNGYTSNEIAFQRAFREQFGEIDPNHTWSTVTRSTVTVGVDMPGFDDSYTLRVYTANPRGKVSNCYLLGQWEINSSSSAEQTFDMPAGLSTVWVAVTNPNGGRYVQEAKIVDHKCVANFTMEGNNGTKTRAVIVSEEWRGFPLEDYYNDRGTGFIQIYPENDVDYESGICTDFEIVATGDDDIKLTLFYSFTSNTNTSIKYFIYRPEDNQSVKEAFQNTDSHQTLCQAACMHMNYHSGYYNDYLGFVGEWKEPTKEGGTNIGMDNLIREGYKGNGGINNDADGFAIRGKTFTIPQNDLQAGDHIVFYLVWSDNTTIAATRASLNAGSYAFAGLLNTGERTYLGFEDALGDGKPNNEYDLNDVVYVIEGGYTVEDHEDELPRDMSYIIAYEDLGASDDFDFNDIVARVYHVSGTNALTTSILAAGGTLPVSMYYGEKTLFKDIHSIFGGTVVNVDGGNLTHTPITKRIEYDNTQEHFSFDKFRIEVEQPNGTRSDIHAPQYYDIPTQNDNTLVEGGTNERLYPYAILISDPNWEWPAERQNINSKYEKFADWVKKADHTSWFGDIWNGCDDSEDTPSGGDNNFDPIENHTKDNNRGANAIWEYFGYYIESSEFTDATSVTIKYSQSVNLFYAINGNVPLNDTHDVFEIPSDWLDNIKTYGLHIGFYDGEDVYNNTSVSIKIDK